MDRRWQRHGPGGSATGGRSQALYEPGTLAVQLGETWSCSGRARLESKTTTTTITTTTTTTTATTITTNTSTTTTTTTTTAQGS
eukprot:11469824-Heterocapsa_arctica.AAC.1